MGDINMKKPESKENNKMIIIIATVAIVALVAIFVGLGLSFGWFGGKGGKVNEKATSAKSGQEVKAIQVEETKGSDSATRKLNLKLRDIKFGSSIKKVKAFEDKQEDTLKNPSQSKETKDGYTYLTYTFSDKAKINGVKPAPQDRGSLLQYVFKDKKMFEIRMQYGDISKKDQKKARKAFKDQYGKTTNYVKFDNGSYKDVWRSKAKSMDKETILTFNYSPEMGVVVSHERVGR